MWGNPFRQRAEHRESVYTDSIIASILANASGKTIAAPSATGALEASAGMVARCFSLATVEAPAYAQRALSPLLLSSIGRSMVRAGEIVFAIDVSADGELRLLPAQDWDLDGDADPASWVYRLTLAGPSRFTSRSNVPAAGVVHVRHQVDPDRFWKGIGPLQSARLAGRLSAETISALADEASGPRGAVMPLPIDGEDTTAKALKADLAGLKGGLALVESVKTMHAGAMGNAPGTDWTAKRIGASPPEGLVTVAGRASVEVYSACGIPAALMVERADGTSLREALRRLLHTTIQPMAQVAASELSEKLEADVTLNFDRLFAADLSGRSRAFQSMVKGGISIEKAAGLSGLMESDGD